MTILPSLTSTKPDAIPTFLEALERTGVTQIALFPTTLKTEQRSRLYRELERFPGLTIPHVHLRSDCGDAEIGYLAWRFGTEVFNVHPRESGTAYVPESSRWLKQIYLENVDALPDPEQLKAFAGVCPDFSHWEAARRVRDAVYHGFDDVVRAFPIGCCHVSAIREGDPNPWNGRTDHHAFRNLSDLDYIVAYRDFLPPKWISLELENSLEDQLEAASYLSSKGVGAVAASTSQRYGSQNHR